MLVEYRNQIEESALDKGIAISQVEQEIYSLSHRLEENYQLQTVSLTAAYELFGPEPTGDIAIVATVNEAGEIIDQVFPSDVLTRYELNAVGATGIELWVHPSAQMAVSLSEDAPFNFEFLQP